VSDWKVVGYIGHVKDKPDAKILIVKLGETRYCVSKQDFDKFVKGETEFCNIMEFPK
jgi:hypothetical protein